MISRERVKVEHAIGGVKRFKIVSTIFRAVTHSTNDVFEMCCGLWNPYIKMAQKIQLEWVCSGC